MKKDRRLGKIIKIIKIIIIITILILFFFVLDNKLNEENIKFEEEKSNEYNNVITEKSISDETIEEKETDIVLKKYKGYESIAKLTIPKINVETYVLSEYSPKALEISVTKFWGPNPNEIRQFLHSRT